LKKPGAGEISGVSVGMPHNVFISYSSQDGTIADAVCAALEKHSIQCWIAPRDVLPGMLYGEALIDALNESRLFVLIFSSNSNDSVQVMREVERAVSKGVPIIPFRIDSVTPSKTMEFFLSSPHWLDASQPPLEKHLEHLYKTIRLMLSKSEVSSTQSKIAVENLQSETRIDDSRVESERTMFNEFLMGIASSAFIYLGLVEHPATGRRQVDMTAAKESIDMLVMLREKTRGNLTHGEEKFFDELLSDLKKQYVSMRR
jgi:hypothetical protein